MEGIAALNSLDMIGALSLSPDFYCLLFSRPEHALSSGHDWGMTPSDLARKVHRVTVRMTGPMLANLCRLTGTDRRISSLDALNTSRLFDANNLLGILMLRHTPISATPD